MLINPKCKIQIAESPDFNFKYISVRYFLKIEKLIKVHYLRANLEYT